MISELEHRIKALLTTFKDIKSDKRIKIMLEYALAAGNYLNGSGFRGGASGFKIEVIQSLENIKSNDRKKNLLMSLIGKAEEETGIELVDI
jgi:hypothetical protein